MWDSWLPSPSHFPSLCEATDFLLLLMEGIFKMLFVLIPSFGGLRVLWEHLVAVVSNSNDYGEWSGWHRREGDRWVGWGLRKWLSEWENGREAVGTEEEAKVRQRRMRTVSGKRQVWEEPSGGHHCCSKSSSVKSETRRKVHGERQEHGAHRPHREREISDLRDVPAGTAQTEMLRAPIQLSLCTSPASMSLGLWWSLCLPKTPPHSL